MKRQRITYELSPTVTYNAAYFVRLHQHEEDHKALLRETPRPVTSLEDLFNIYPNQFEQYYANRTLDNLLEKIAKILNERLQPGNGKHNLGGTKIPLGSCKFDIFDYFFGHVNKAIRTHRVYSKIVDGVNQPRRKFYYSWPALRIPNLLLPMFKWYKRDHGTGHGMFKTHLMSKYLEMTLVIDEQDERVHCLYLQGTYSEVLQNKWISTI